MRLIVQRCSSASVTIAQRVHSSIERGVCVLVGLHRSDTEADVDALTDRLLALPVMASLSSSSSLPSSSSSSLVSVPAAGGEILLVSQFTLYGVMQGNKPDFHAALGGDEAPRLYARFVDGVRRKYRADRVKDGVFAAMMEVSIDSNGNGNGSSTGGSGGVHVVQLDSRPDLS